MSENEKCPLCENLSSKKQFSYKMNERGEKTEAIRYEYSCPLCGEFVMSHFVLSQIKDEKYKDKLFIISGHIKNQNLKGKEVEIRSREDIDDIINSYYPKTPMEKLNHFINYLGDNTKFFGEPINIDPKTNYPIVYSSFDEGSDEFRNIINSGEELKYVEYVMSPSIREISEDNFFSSTEEFKLSFEGYKKYEELKNSNVNSKICFVAMEFDEENRFKKLYESSIKKALSKALEGKFEPYCLIDKQHNGLIDDAIIAGINKSRFMIAEFSTQNRGVYFEVGYAEGRKIEVIKICDQKILDEKKLHFDIEHYNFIGYNNPADLERKLINRIEARFF